MISVSDALAELFKLMEPVGTETVSIRHAAGRVLARDVVSGRDQPPFATSAMDGYAVRLADATQGTPLDVIGTSAAGHAFNGQVSAGEAVRIFTGAPLPQGAEAIVIQENARREGDTITLTEDGAARHIRPSGGDFHVSDRLPAGRRMTPSDVTLAAAMNAADVTVHRRPQVAILCTGDELVAPGGTPRPDQIVASNGIGLAAQAEEAGATAHLLPIARDTRESLQACLGLAAGADLIVTCGGASVGDFDLLAQDDPSLGLTRVFHKVAIRPGKPVMAGHFGTTPMIGLPGNPVSSLVCGLIFMCPAILCMSGLPPRPAQCQRLTLGHDMPTNGPREHYMRARVSAGIAMAFDSQDSSLQSVLSSADALIIRPANAPPAQAGTTIDAIPLRDIDTNQERP